MKYSIIPVTPFQQNCSLIWCEKSKQAALIDPGGDIENILAEVQKQQVEVVKILLTHGHIDHVGAVASIAKQLQLNIEGPHSEDQFWLAMLGQQSSMMGLPAVEGFQPDRWLAHKDTISVGELTLEVLHCPGHTPGHVVFFHRPTQMAFVGDVIFQGGIGRTDFPKGDYATLLNSIRENLLTLGDEVQFVPGHGPMSTFGHERKTNPFLC